MKTFLREIYLSDYNIIIIDVVIALNMTVIISISQAVPTMRRTVENIKDPLFRFYEREVNAGSKLLQDVRQDMEEVMLVCQGEQKATNHHRQLINELVKGKESIMH